MTLRIGVIGTGAIGQTHIDRITNVLSGGAIVALADFKPEFARNAAQKFGLDATVYETGVELINSDNVDAVIVTSSGDTHEEYVLAAIEAGKPVFCEKPLATTADGCKRIVDVEIKHGKRRVQVGFMRRYDQGYRDLKRVITEDRIGAPLLLHCAHRNPDVPEQFKGDMAIIDSVVHEFDVLRWLLDDEYVTAQVVLPRRSRLAREDLQDPHLILLETRGGIRIQIESFVTCQYGYDIQCQVVGEKGTADLPEPSAVAVRHDASLSRGIVTNWGDRFREAFNVEFQEWINAALQGEVHGPSAWDGYVVSVTTDVAVQAKHSGEIARIPIPERPAFYGD